MFENQENEKLVRKTLKPLSDGTYEIYRSESKSFYFVLVAFVFSLASIYLIKGGYPVTGKIFLVGFVGAAGMALKMVLFKKMVLIINSRFIVVHPLIGESEQILWDDIAEFKEIRDKHMHYIAVMVNDPEYMLEMQTNKLTYKIMHHNIKLYGTPYLIPTDNLNAHGKEIIKLLQTFHEEFLEQGVL